MSYDMQLEMKRNQVKNVLEQIAHLYELPADPVLGMKDPCRDRNKIQIPVGEGKDGLITGFYQQRSHHIIEDMDTCVIQNELGDRMVEAVRRISGDLGISAYDEANHRGVLRHIIVRTAFETNDTMIILITRTKKLPKETELVKQLVETYPAIKSIIHNVNDEKTNVILGKNSRTIYGDNFIVDSIGELKFKISAQSFYQVNPVQTKVLYEKARSEERRVGKESINTRKMNKKKNKEK